jgi:lipoyl(octanoyl) transferase
VKPLPYPPATWRLIREPYPKPGPLNMAVDEAILRTVADRAAPPTVRLYGWSPPTMTLGRGQPFEDADLPALRRHGVTLVRRMTGGTAVLNRDELTYMVAVPAGEVRFSGSVAESYRGVSEALLDALRRLGVRDAEARGRADGGERPHAPARSTSRSVVCFEIPSDYEITVGTRKLVGSSQMRVRGGILQHGSLPLTGDIADISRFLKARPDPARIRSRAVPLDAVVGHAVTWEETADAVVGALMEVLNLTLVESPLVPAERERMDTLVSEKYGNEAWTRRL